MADVLQHCFLQTDRARGRRWVPEVKGFFLSHYQANAGPSAMRLKTEILRCGGEAGNEAERHLRSGSTDKFSAGGIHVWLDKDEKPTEEGLSLIHI